MNRVLLSLLSAAVATALLTTPALAADKKAKKSDNSDKASWQPLFDGKDTSKWRGYKATAFPAKGWRVENGTLRHVAGEGGGDLITVDKFTDFELRFDWKVAPGANSGVIYRVTFQSKRSSKSAYLSTVMRSPPPSPATWRSVPFSTRHPFEGNVAAL